MKQCKSLTKSEDKIAFNNEKEFSEFLNIIVAYLKANKPDGYIILFGNKGLELAKNIREYENLGNSIELGKSTEIEGFNERILIKQEFQLKDSWRTRELHLFGVANPKNLSVFDKLAVKQTISCCTFTVTPFDTLSAPALAILAVSESMFFKDTREHELKQQILNLLQMTVIHQHAKIAYGITVIKNNNSSRQKNELTFRINHLEKKWNGEAACEFFKNLGGVRSLALIESYEEYSSKKDYLGKSSAEHPLEKIFGGKFYNAITANSNQPLSELVKIKVQLSSTKLVEHCITHFNEIAKITKKSLLNIHDLFNCRNSSTTLHQNLENFTLSNFTIIEPTFFTVERLSFSEDKHLWPLEALKYIRTRHNELINQVIEAQGQIKESQVDSSSIFFTQDCIHFLFAVSTQLGIISSLSILEEKLNIKDKAIKQYYNYSITSFHLILSNFHSFGFTFTDDIKELMKASCEIFNNDFKNYIDSAIKHATLQIDPDKINCSKLYHGSEVFHYLEDYSEEEECIKILAQICAKIPAKHRPQHAAQYFLKSLIFDPKQFALYGPLGETFMHMNKYEEALAFFRVTENVEKIENCIKQLDTFDTIETKLTLGDIWMQLCQFKKAQEFYLKADLIANILTEKHIPEEGTRKIIAQKVYSATNEKLQDVGILKKYSSMLETNTFYDYDLLDLEYFLEILGTDQSHQEG